MATFTQPDCLAGKIIRVTNRLCIYLLLWLLLVGCMPQASAPSNALSVYTRHELATAAFQPYTDADRRFSISYPAGWTLVQPEHTVERIHFLDLSVPHDQPTIGVTVVVDKPVKQLAVVADRVENYLQQQAGVTEMRRSSEAVVEVNGLNGIERSHTYAFVGIRMVQRTIYLTHPHYTFTLAFVAPQDHILQEQPLFEEILRSFTAD